MVRGGVEAWENLGRVVKRAITRCAAQHASAQNNLTRSKSAPGVATGSPKSQVQTLPTPLSPSNAPPRGVKLDEPDVPVLAGGKVFSEQLLHGRFPIVHARPGSLTLTLPAPGAPAKVPTAEMTAAATAKWAAAASREPCLEGVR